MQRPLVRSQWSQTVQREINAFAYAHTSGTGEQQGIRRQVIDAVEFLLQPVIFFCGQGPGKILRLRWEILRENQPGLEGIARVGKVEEQPPEAEQVYLTSMIRQRRGLFAEAPEPAEQVGIAAQLGKPAELRKVGVEIA